MKKIININLSGRVIPIEDSAYESLQRYIESLRRYFANEEGRDEIINDIESRIAELMNDKIKKGAAAVTDADIAEIIATMGNIEDFERADATDTDSKEEAAGQTFTQARRERFKGRLYRDTSDKLLGGVCSGAANYMNIDPAVVRLLFAIVTFGGFGFGILIYVLLWIILPARNLESYVGKRLFRNPDDRIIAGVAGGLGEYFHKPAWIIRIIFAGPLVLNILFGSLNGIFFAFHRDIFPNFFIGSFTGTFIMAYIILWIVLPQAVTQYDKMEMRGETIDVNRIRQNVQEEMEQFKTNAKNMADDVRTSAQQFTDRARGFANTRGRAFASEFGETARPVARGFGHAIGVLFKAFFLFVAGSIAFGLFVFLIVAIFGGGAAIWPIKQSVLGFMLNGFWQNLFFWGALLFFFAVPLIAFITWLVRRIMKVKTQRHYLGWVFGGLWLVGLFSLIFLVTSLVSDMHYYDKVPQRIAMTQPAGRKLMLRIDEPEVRYGGEIWFIDNNSRGWDIDNNTMRMANIKVRVTKSSDSDYIATVWKYSAGRTRNDAQARASKIRFNTSVADSTLILGSGLAIDKSSKFRGQKIIVEIKVPVGKKIRFDESMAEKLHSTNINLRMGVRRSWDDYGDSYDRDWNSDPSFDFEPNEDYIMTAEGQLELVNKKENASGNDNNEEYRYHRGNADSIQMEIDKKERELERLKNIQENTPETPERPEQQERPEKKEIKKKPIKVVYNTKEVVDRYNPFLPLII